MTTLTADDIQSIVASVAETHGADVEAVHLAAGDLTIDIADANRSADPADRLKSILTSYMRDVEIETAAAKRDHEWRYGSDY
jgi:hypothetical protein